MKEIQTEKSTVLVYVVVRYGQVMGCYSDMNAAIKQQQEFIMKGAICDLIVKPLI